VESCIARALRRERTGAHQKRDTFSVADRRQCRAPVIHDSAAESKRLAKPDEDQPPDARLLAYLAQHLSVSSEAGLCSARPGHALAATPQFRRFEFTFTCPSARDIKLHSSAFFELVPSHVTFAQITTGSGDLVEQLFTEDQQQVDASAGDERLRDANFLSISSSASCTS